MSTDVLADVRRAVAAAPYRVVHVGRLYLSDCISASAGNAIWTLDLDEDDGWAWRYLAQTQALGEAAWSRAEADAEDQLLARMSTLYGHLFVAGPANSETVKVRHPALQVEISENAIAFPPLVSRSEQGDSLLFVGALSYAPNRDGLLWFMRHVWPLLQNTASPPRLRVAGGPIPAEVAEIGNWDRVELLGHVPDLAPLYAGAALALAPLHTGAGTRLKVIEAVAHGVPVVATSIGVRGLSFAQRDTIWLADTAESFSTAILEALAHPAERRARAEMAYSRARATHDRLLVVDRLASRFAAVLACADGQ